MRSGRAGVRAPAPAATGSARAVRRAAPTRDERKPSCSPPARRYRARSHREAFVRVPLHPQWPRTTPRPARRAHHGAASMQRGQRRLPRRGMARHVEAQSSASLPTRAHRAKARPRRQQSRAQTPPPAGGGARAHAPARPSQAMSSWSHETGRLVTAYVNRFTPMRRACS